VDLKLEVVPIPVTDVDAAKRFYTEQVGFHLDHDIAPQLLPSGSAKNANLDPGAPSGPSCWTSLIGTPRSSTTDRTESMSSTTSCTPLTEPGAPSGRPMPITTEHAEPGGVICTTLIPGTVQELKRQTE
jgi:catechol 2,3-dioxygenase-like lactoylglutathione lyase family enzyme